MRRYGEGSKFLIDSWLGCMLITLVCVCGCAFSRAIKMNLANEGLEAQRQEAEQIAKKRKAEADKLWEGTVSSYSASLQMTDSSDGAFYVY